jgi:hypothetical protein
MNKKATDNENISNTATAGQGSTGVGGGGIDKATSESQPRSAGSPAHQGPGDGGVISQVQDTGKDLANKGVQAIGDKTKSTAEGYKSEITGGLHTLADGLRQTSSNFRTEGEGNALASAGARYIGDLAEKIESVSGYFERKDTMDLIRDVRGFAKRNPTVFVGGAFAVGFALSRVIRSGASSTAGSRSVGSRMGTGGDGSPMRTGTAGSSSTLSSSTGSPMRGGTADSPIRG